MRQKHSCLLVKRLYSYSQGPWEDKKCVVLLAVYCVQGSFAYWEHRVISKFSGPFGNCLIDRSSPLLTPSPKLWLKVLWFVFIVFQMETLLQLSFNQTFLWWFTLKTKYCTSNSPWDNYNIMVFIWAAKPIVFLWKMKPSKMWVCIISWIIRWRENRILRTKREDIWPIWLKFYPVALSVLKEWWLFISQDMW